MPTERQLDRQHESILVQEENRTGRDLAVFFAALLREVLNRWEDIGIAGARAAITNSQDNLEQILESTYLRSGTRGARFTSSMLEEEEDEFDADLILMGLLLFASSEVQPTAAEILNTTLKIFDKLVADAQIPDAITDPMISKEELMKEVGKEFNNRNKGRIGTISTTEAGKGISQGQADQADIINRRLVGETLKKSWRSVGDSRVRPTHVSANSRYRRAPIENHENFRVGSSFGLYPRASTLSSAESIGCRCFVIYRKVKVII